MRITGVPNKYEILQQYYLEENGEQITYNEAITLYYELNGDDKENFLKYYNDYCKEYYENDNIEYQPIDENGYTWKNAKSGSNGYNQLAKNDIRIKYTLEAYAKERGLTLDPQWAGYSAEEIIQMENNGVNIPQDVLDMAHSIYETSSTNYISTTTNAEDEATSEQESFLELVPKAVQKIEKCEENNEKISDKIDELLPEKQKREREFSDKIKEQMQSLEKYEALIKEWNKIQTKINNGEALSDKEAQRYAQLTGMFEEKKSNSDDTGFNIDKQEIAKSLNEINIYVSLGEDLADETIEIGDTLADYTSKTNYKTTAKTVTKEIGFIRTIIAMVKGKTLAKEAAKVGNDTKEYTLDTKASVNDIATVLDIKDQIVSTEPNTPESEIETGAVQETDPESTQAKEETKAPEVTKEEDFVITDDSVKQLTSEAADINGDLLAQSVKAVKSIRVAKDYKKFAALANFKVTRLVKAFKEAEEKRQQETETLENENKQLKKEITDLTGESEEEIDKSINSGKDDSSKYDGMEESDKKTVEQNKQTISSNNQTISNLQEEGEQAKETFKAYTSKEKTALDKAIPEENQAIAEHTEQKEEIIPQAKEDLDFTKNSGITLTKIGKYRFKVGLIQIASLQFAKGFKNMKKGAISMGIGIAARTMGNSIVPRLADKTTTKAISGSNEALKLLNTTNEKIVAITGEDTPQGVSQGQEEQKQEDENKEKANDKAVTDSTTSSESPEEVVAKTDDQATKATEDNTKVISNSKPSNNESVTVSPVRQATKVENMVATKKNTNKTGEQSIGVNNNSSSTSASSNSTDEIPAISKDNAKSEAADANKNLGSMKSETEKGQKETESITKDEEKSEKELEKEAKNLEKQINKEAKEMEKLQKETERIQQKQTQILVQYEQLTAQNEQLTAEAQAAAANQAAQGSNNQGQQTAGLLGSNSFNAGQAQNSAVTEKISSIETNNQTITQLGLEFTSNDKIVLRNQKKITASQKFIKTSNKKFQKVTKAKEQKANERVKSEEAKQKALQRKLGLVGIFEKVFQAVTSIGSLLSAIPFTAPLGLILTKIGIGGTLLCASVKAGILAANGMIDQAFITLGMSIATAALSMVGAGEAASAGIQIATASLNVVSSAASLGASVQEFKGKDSGILGSIATIAGAASAITGAVGAFSSFGDIGDNISKEISKEAAKKLETLMKVSTVATQSGSLLSTSSQMINQVREWNGKEGDSKAANIIGMIGMGLTIAGTIGNQAAKSKNIKLQNAAQTDNTKTVNNTENTNNTENVNNNENAEKTEGQDSKNKTENKENNTTNTQNPTNNEVKTQDNQTNSDVNTVKTENNTQQTDVQQKQSQELKQAATKDSQTATEEIVAEIEQKTNAEQPNAEQPDVEQPNAEQTPENIEGQNVENPKDNTDKTNGDTNTKENTETEKAKAKSKFQKFMEASDPYMEMLGNTGELVSILMTNNDETDDDTKRKVIPAWEFDRRTQEIMKKHRKRLDYLKKRYYA